MPATVTHRERAYRFVRQGITNGEFSLGQRLSDADLAARIGVSRTPVREAISRLESEGLVEQVPRFGAFVRRLTRKEVEDLYDLRILMEGYAAERAVDHIDGDGLDRLEQIVDRLHTMARIMRDAGQNEMTPEQTREWVSLDVAFHVIVVRASGNAHVGKIIADFRVLSSLCGERRSHPDISFLRGQASTWADHRRILRFLRRRDAAAAGDCMRQHISRAKAAALLRHDRSSNSEAAASDPWRDSISELLGDMEGIA